MFSYGAVQHWSVLYGSVTTFSFFWVVTFRWAMTPRSLILGKNAVRESQPWLQPRTNKWNLQVCMPGVHQWKTYHSSVCHVCQSLLTSLDYSTVHIWLEIILIEIKEETEDTKEGLICSCAWAAQYKAAQ